MVLTVSFGLSPVTGLSCHRRYAGIASRKLDASIGASGPHDFAVRISAARLASLPRPPHPAPNVRDDAYAPLIEAGWRINKAVSTKPRSEIFFAKGLDTKIAKQPVGQISSPHEPTGRADVAPPGFAVRSEAIDHSLKIGCPGNGGREQKRRRAGTFSARLFVRGSGDGLAVHRRLRRGVGLLAGKLYPRSIGRLLVGVATG